MLGGVECWLRGLLAQSLAFVGLAVVGFFWRLSFDGVCRSTRSRPASATFCFGLRFRTLWLFLSSHQAQRVYRFILFRPFTLLLPQHRHHGYFFLCDSIGSILSLKNYAQSFDFPFSSYPQHLSTGRLINPLQKLASLFYLVQIHTKEMFLLSLCSIVH